MYVKVLEEAGLQPAIYGLGLSHGVSSDKRYEDVAEYAPRLASVADRLSGLDGGHNKFLRQVILWMHIEAPRYFWQDFDQYKVGTVSQSESTMHTILKRPLTKDDFAGGLTIEELYNLESIRKTGDLVALKRRLPEGFIQGRVVSMNYQVLRTMLSQRSNHKLPEWGFFITSIMSQAKHPEWLTCRA